MGVAPATPADRTRAEELAGKLDIDLLATGSRARDIEAGQALLLYGSGGPSLQLTGPAAPGPVTVDFANAALATRRRAGHNELLGKAVGWKQARAPRILDSTGGYGTDAFLLADLGCDVLLCEREPVMAELLQDALERARSGGDPWLQGVCSRMQLRAQDAQSLTAAELAAIDVIYIDPMFPQDRRAAPAKEMQVLHQLLAARAQAQGAHGGDPSGEAKPLPGEELLSWAGLQPVRRIVVKRPRRAQPLPGPRPGHSVTGKSVRFDVYPRN